MTFALMAFNQVRFIAEAVSSALAQDYSPLEVILSDDCSSDGTFEIIAKMAASYEGPHNIVLNRNEHNLGLSEHFNQILKIATSRYIVLAAGDDISLTTRTSHSIRCLLADTQIVMVSTSILEFWESGQPETKVGVADVREIEAVGYFGRRAPHPPGCSRAFRREVFDEFGPLRAECPTEDTPLLLRAFLLGRVFLLPEIGVRYRRHRGAISQGSTMAAMNVAAIGRQYNADLGAALSSGLLTIDEHEHLSRILGAYVRHREMVSSARNRALSPIKLLQYLTTTESGPRDKLSLLKLWVQELGWPPHR